MRPMRCCGTPASMRPTASRARRCSRSRSHVTHEAEARALEPLYVTTRVLEVDDKRVRLFHSLHRAARRRARRHRRADLPARRAAARRRRWMRRSANALSALQAAQAQPARAGQGRAGRQARGRLTGALQSLRNADAQDRRSRAAPRRDRAGRLPGGRAVRFRPGDDRAHRPRGGLYDRHGGALLRHQAGHHHRGPAAHPAAHRGTPDPRADGAEPDLLDAAHRSAADRRDSATPSARSGSHSGARCRRTSA